MKSSRRWQALGFVLTTALPLTALADGEVCSLHRDLPIERQLRRLSMDLKGKVLVRVEEASHGEINMSGPIKVAGSAEGGGTVTLKTKTGP